GLANEAGLADLDIPAGILYQRVGVSEAYRLPGIGYFDRVALRGGEFADQRILRRRANHEREVTRGRYVPGRQTGRIGKLGVSHAERLRLGVHRRNERRQSARVMPAEAGRR